MKNGGFSAGKRLSSPPAEERPAGGGTAEAVAGKNDRRGQRCTGMETVIMRFCRQERTQGKEGVYPSPPERFRGG